MDFYKARRQLINELERVIHKKKGQSVKIDSFCLEVARTYGFGSKIVMAVLEQYKGIGRITISDDETEFYVIDHSKEEEKKVSEEENDESKEEVKEE